MLGISRAAVSRRVSLGRDPIAERGDSRSKNKAAIKKPDPPPRICPQCDRPFDRPKGYSRSTFVRKVACSPACANILKSKRHMLYGVALTLKEISVLLDVSVGALAQRLRKGGSFAATRPATKTYATRGDALEREPTKRPSMFVVPAAIWNHANELL